MKSCKKNKTVFLTLVLLAISFLSLSPLFYKKKENPFGLSKEERGWLDKFMRDMMLDENWIYTLWGTKPMCRELLYYLTEEEEDAINKEKLQSDNVVWVYNFDARENWEKFKQIREKFPLKRYFLFETKHKEEPAIHSVYFVNILETVRVLEEHYEIFKQVAGVDFDPFTIVQEIPQEESLFWEKIRDNCLTLGILFGYGLDNATYFRWIHGEETENKEILSLLYSIREVGIKKKYQEDFISYGFSRISHFPLPTFASYFLYDPVVKKYEAERKAIQKTYKGHDFLDLTLLQLTK